MKAKHLLALLAPLALSVSPSAHAGVTVTQIGPGGVPLPILSGFGSIATFDTITQTPYGSTNPTGSFTDGGGSWSGTGVVMNNHGGGAMRLYAEPYNDTSNYMAVLKNQSETVTYRQTYSELGLYWGSIDTYNDLTLYDGAFSVTIPVPAVANGDQLSDLSNRYFVIRGFEFDKAVFNSGDNSFEFDNVAVGGAVPEPSTWAMLLLGLAGVGLLAGYRRAAKAA